jgi:sigma-B regulation protein RsbU (phosphoserine phosphatase)
VTLASAPRSLLLTLAALFALATTVYSAVWIYVVHTTPGYFGIEHDPDPDGAERVVRVVEGSPAAAAGLRPGDRLTHVDGVPIPRRPLRLVNSEPGREVRLDLERPGSPAPLSVVVVLGKSPYAPENRSAVRRFVDEVLGTYPLPFLVVGVAVLFLRPRDRNAWLLALVFASFIAGAPMLPWEARIPAGLRRFILAYLVAFTALSAGVFCYLFSVFPAPSPIDRRLPWLKRVWLAFGVGWGIPLSLWVLATGSAQPLIAFANRVPALPRTVVGTTYFLGGYLLGLASLVWNARAGHAEARRKGRVIVWGVVLGFGPSLLLTTAAEITRRSMDAFPFWVWAPCVIALLLIPLSFAYAVVKHRVLDVPVLLRRSARYLLVQRGSIVLLLLLAVATTSLFATTVGARLTEETGPHAVVLGALFGTALLWAGLRVQRRVREGIDRAFFRSAYDARQILQDLAERARTATSREELAEQIVHQVESALMPQWLGVYADDGSGAHVLAGGAGPGLPARIPGALPLLGELAGRGEPLAVPPSQREATGPLAALEPECVVPLLGRGGRLAGLIALGPRLSEEPYSREDKRLLASVAGQAGMALEGIRMAEEMARRLETERRGAHEMELAQQVQHRLLPQEAPPLRTLDYAGRCVQARAVGGDYYDFLDLGPGRLGMVLADVSGKGLPAALLMASLQASLRSRSARDLADLPLQLHAVNQLLFRSSDLSRYATLFLGVYDDQTRRLVYANCGHNPPVVMRAEGGLERLSPTAPVLGLLLEEWECATGEIELRPGDLLALYTDGVTEAWSDTGEEFGEQRLVEALGPPDGASAATLIEAVVGAVSAWSGATQEDDLTLVVARVV